MHMGLRDSGLRVSPEQSPHRPQRYIETRGHCRDPYGDYKENFHEIWPMASGFYGFGPWGLRFRTSCTGSVQVDNL